MRPLADRSSGRLLVEDPSIAEYYLPAGSQWQRWSCTRNIVLPTGANTGGPSDKAGVVGDGNAAAFARYIAQGYFSLVALNFADTKPLDHSIAADLRRNHRYQHRPGRPLRPRPGYLRHLAIRAVTTSGRRTGTMARPAATAGKRQRPGLVPAPSA